MVTMASKAKIALIQMHPKVGNPQNHLEAASLSSTALVAIFSYPAPRVRVARAW